MSGDTFRETVEIMEVEFENLRLVNAWNDRGIRSTVMVGIKRHGFFIEWVIISSGVIGVLES